jgi:hypothetical protein
MSAVSTLRFQSRLCWCFWIGLFFVVQNLQRRSIHGCYIGYLAVSTVRLPATHRAYIREVSKWSNLSMIDCECADTLKSLNLAYQTRPWSLDRMWVCRSHGTPAELTECIPGFFTGCKHVHPLFCLSLADQTCSRLLDSRWVCWSFIEFKLRSPNSSRDCFAYICHQLTVSIIMIITFPCADLRIW